MIKPRLRVVVVPGGESLVSDRTLMFERVTAAVRVPRVRACVFEETERVCWHSSRSEWNLIIYQDVLGCTVGVFVLFGLPHILNSLCE